MYQTECITAVLLVLAASKQRTGCSSIVEHLLKAQCTIESILLSAPIKLFLVQASTPQLGNKNSGMYYHVYHLILYPLLL